MRLLPSLMVTALLLAPPVLAADTLTAAASASPPNMAHAEIAIDPPTDAELPASDDVPAISPKAQIQGAAMPPVNLLSNKQSVLTHTERRSVEMSAKWKNAEYAPGTGDSGRVVFRYGATLPTLVCAPLYVCDLELQSGETVNNINIGDSVRWVISPAQSGSSAMPTTHVIIKPTDTDLSTNLIVTTNRRTYVIKLVSRKNDWMPFISFSYPEDEEAAWAKIAANQMLERQNTVMADTGQSIDKLDFGYKLSGDRPSWKPERVYSDGVKTYIQFPHSMQYADSPILVGLDNDGGLFSDPSTQIVNYRIQGDRFVVDKVLSKAALISGVGSDQEKVEIDRVGAK